MYDKSRDDKLKQNKVKFLKAPHLFLFVLFIFLLLALHFKQSPISVYSNKNYYKENGQVDEKG